MGTATLPQVHSAHTATKPMMLRKILLPQLSDARRRVTLSLEAESTRHLAFIRFLLRIGIQIHDFAVLCSLYNSLSSLQAGGKIDKEKETVFSFANKRVCPFSCNPHMVHVLKPVVPARGKATWCFTVPIPSPSRGIWKLHESRDQHLKQAKKLRLMPAALVRGHPDQRSGESICVDPAGRVSPNQAKHRRTPFKLWAYGKST